MIWSSQSSVALYSSVNLYGSCDLHVLQLRKMALAGASCPTKNERKTGGLVHSKCTSVRLMRCARNVGMAANGIQNREILRNWGLDGHRSVVGVNDTSNRRHDRVENAIA